MIRKLNNTHMQTLLYQNFNLTPAKSAQAVINDKMNAYATKIAKDVNDEAKRVSTVKFTNPVNKFACI